MPKTSTKGLTHCIIRSGYTGRLVDLLGFVKIDITQNNIYKISYSKETDEYKNLCQILNDMWLDENSIDSFLERFVFIQDSLEGEGTYYTDINEFNKIKNILNEEDFTQDGIICFKCEHVLENMRYVDILEKLNFCEFFGHETICEVEIIERDDIKIMVTHIDAADN